MPISRKKVLPGTLGYSWWAVFAGIGWGGDEGKVEVLITLTPVTRAGVGPDVLTGLGVGDTDTHILLLSETMNRN